MNASWLVRQLCRMYSVFLYAYPREFRLEYGGEMRQVFRDGCRDAAQHPGSLHLMRFAARSTADWLASTVREGYSSLAEARKPVQRGWVAEWAVAGLVYFFVSTTLVQAYVVPTGSMDGTLKIGDHILVDRATYATPGWGRHLLPYREVQRGDIVAFRYPEDVEQTYVKRVIGVPGDRIRLENKQVIRNGSHLREPYAQFIDSSRDVYRDDFPARAGIFTTPRGRDMLARHVVNGEVVVPAGMLFMMGDNRDNSADSRYWGFVPRENVVGRPLVVYWSYDATTERLQSWSLDHLMDVATHFFTKTRWERTFRVPRSEEAAKVEP